MNPLRPYQETAVTDALAALAQHGSAILQMPTGAGKTRTAVEIIKRTEGVVWFFCHRVEIAQQAARAFKAAGIDFGVVSPRAVDPATGEKYPFEPQKRVQIISVGALARRIADLPRPALVVWDECHHTPAPTWATIRAGLVDARHLGLTATPQRLDGKGLAEWFGALVVGPPIETLIHDGWLSPYRYFAPSDPDLTSAKMHAGDYAKKDLAKIMNTPVLIGDAVTEYRRVADGKRAIAFCASVDASKALVDRFNGAGVPAMHVDGTTGATERGEAVRALETGAIKVLSNVEIFTEGFDVPGIEAAILMRPTRSPTLLLQMIGRALRPAPGKVAVVMDHAGLWQDQGAFSRDWHWSLDGGAAKARRCAGVRGSRRCPGCKEVRSERVIVCDGCGFEFPTGREIGEYDGVLTEVDTKYVDPVIPPGCESQSAFSRRTGLSLKTINYYVRRSDMPNEGGHPIIAEALVWLSGKAKHTPAPGCATVKELTQIFGVSRSFLETKIKSGQIPTLDGYPIIDTVRELLLNNPVLPPEGCESFTDFARRIDRKYHTVKSWATKGMPSRMGFVDIAPALLWCDEFREDSLAPAGCESVAAFARRHSTSHETVCLWVKKGMPKEGRWIPKENANHWVSENVDFSKIRARTKVAPDKTPIGYENLSSFARRHGVTPTLVSNWRRKGLPCKENLVSSAKGDEWVANHVDKNKIKKHQENFKIPDGYISVSGLSRRLGIPISAVKKLAENFAIRALNFKYLIEDFDKLILFNADASRYIEDIKRNLELPPIGSVYKIDFAKRHGVSFGRVGTWERFGLPSRGRFIPLVPGDAWVAENMHLIQSAVKTGSIGSVGKKRFAHILGWRGGGAEKRVRSLVSIGFPYDPKLGVHIQAGLEWIRDNRPDIVIPPDAWPSSNDNPIATQEAA